MKTQISKQHTNAVSVQSQNTFRKEDPMKKQNSTILKLAAICAMVVITTLTASATWPPCDPAPTTTMVAWYPFDELDGSGFSANLATQNTGTWNGTVVSGWPGYIGQSSLVLDGSTAYVESPSSIATNFGPGINTNPWCGGVYSTCWGDFSIAVWIRVPYQDSGVHTIVDKRSGTAPNIYGYSLALRQGRLLLELADGTGASGYTDFLSSDWLNVYGTGWHHIAVTVTRTTPAGIIFYFDGNPTGFNFDPTVRPGSLVNNSPLRIGASSGPSPANFFFGSMDELQIWNRSLYWFEVTNIFNAGSSGVCKP